MSIAIANRRGSRPRAALTVLSVVFVSSCLAGCAESPGAQDAEFIRNIHGYSPATKSIPDAKLIDLAHEVCTALQAGVAPGKALAIVTSQYPKGNIDVGVAGIGTGIYCPSEKL